jgi:hypothetical protein
MNNYRHNKQTMRAASYGGLFGGGTKFLMTAPKLTERAGGDLFSTKRVAFVKINWRGPTGGGALSS